MQSIWAVSVRTVHGSGTATCEFHSQSVKRGLDFRSCWSFGCQKKSCCVVDLRVGEHLKAQGSEVSWPFNRVLGSNSGRANMANRVLVLKENFDQIAWRIDDLSTSWGYWNLFELLVVTLSIGFVLGYMCAVKFGRAREKPIISGDVSGTQFVVKISVGTQSSGPPRRSIGAQSMCTYKRKILTPRFQVLPELADGVFDVSFSD